MTLQFKACLFAIMIALLLQSCASPKMSEELEQGKITFESGEYHAAFVQLLPIAVKGRKEAQYAVGYMYYYGYGVAQDSESGIFWMTKAAEQQYPPAIQALELIRQHNAEPTTGSHPEANPQNNYTQPPSSRAPFQSSQSSDPLLEQLPPRPQYHPPPPRPPAALSEQDYPTFKPQPAKLVAEHKPVKVTPTHSVALASIDNKFTLQLFGSYHLSDAEQLKTHLSADHLHVWHTMHNDKDWYVLTYGRYQDVHDAVLAKNNLPAKLHSMSPWIRQTDSLKIVT